MNFENTIGPASVYVDGKHVSGPELRETILEPGDYGDIVVDSVTVLNGPITCDNMVIRRGATLKTNGFRGEIRGTLEFCGSIDQGDGKIISIKYDDE